MFRLSYRKFKSGSILCRTLNSSTTTTHNNVAAVGTPVIEPTPIIDPSQNGNEILNDKFTEEFLKQQIKINDFQRIFLSVGSSIAAMLDPRRHDMIACLGETTGVDALQQILVQMQETEEGKAILEEKPRINTKMIDYEELKKLPENTLGYAYAHFLEVNEFDPDFRMEVKFMDDPLLAYIMTRYRESHDLVHTILGIPTNMLGEVAVKWFEAINTGLPMCYGGAVFGAFRLRPKQRQAYIDYYLPWAIKTGKTAKPLMPVYWERRWEQDIDELRKELNIVTLQLQVPK